MKFKKLTIDDQDKTTIMAGHTQFTVEQLENEINANSEIGKKLKSVEKILEENY
jgi:putative AlgH/UPF0301 family transcriptional regulator